MTVLKIAAIFAVIGAVATFTVLAVTEARKPKWDEFKHRRGRQ